jgi:hypothetical protein
MRALRQRPIAVRNGSREDPSYYLADRKMRALRIGSA